MAEEHQHDDNSDESEVTLTDPDWDYIQKSDEQIARGEWIDFDTFAAEMRRRFGIEAE